LWRRNGSDWPWSRIGARFAPGCSHRLRGRRRGQSTCRLRPGGNRTDDRINALCRLGRSSLLEKNLCLRGAHRLRRKRGTERRLRDDSCRYGVLDWAGCLRRRRNWCWGSLDRMCLGCWRRRRSWGWLAHPLRDLGEFTAKFGNLTGQVRDFVAVFPGSFFKQLACIRGSNQSDDCNDRDPQQESDHQYTNDFHSSIPSTHRDRCLIEERTDRSLLQLFCKEPVPGRSGRE